MSKRLGKIFYPNVSLIGPRDLGIGAALVAGLIIFGLATGNVVLLSLMTVGIIWASLNVSWNLVVGYGGVFSFGQIAFFACGAYSSAILNHHFGMSPFLGLLAGGIAGAVGAFLIGAASIRMRGIYVALLTLAFHELMRSLISTDYSGLTGGPNGLAVNSFAEHVTLIGPSHTTYFVALAVFIFALIVVGYVLMSPMGLALVGDRDAENVCTARGVGRTQIQLLAFTVSGFLAGLCGSTYAHYVGVVAPTILSFALVMNLYAMIVIGGLGTFWGPIIGTAILSVITNYFQGIAPQYQSLMTTSLLVVFILFLPGGVVGTLRKSVLRLFPGRKGA